MESTKIFYKNFTYCICDPLYEKGKLLVIAEKSVKAISIIYIPLASIGQDLTVIDRLVAKIFAFEVKKSLKCF